MSHDGSPDHAARSEKGTASSQTRDLTDTHKGNQHYSLEAKLHDAEEQLNEVVHILHENEHKVEERAHKLEELKHRTEHIEHDAAILDSKLEQLPKKD